MSDGASLIKKHIFLFRANSFPHSFLPALIFKLASRSDVRSTFPHMQNMQIPQSPMQQLHYKSVQKGLQLAASW